MWLRNAHQSLALGAQLVAVWGVLGDADLLTGAEIKTCTTYSLLFHMLVVKDVSSQLPDQASRPSYPDALTLTLWNHKP